MKTFSILLGAVLLLTLALAAFANDNVYRYRYGELETRGAPVASATVVKIGDLLAWNGTAVIPLDDIADAGDATANKDAACDIFVGVAMTASAAGDTTWVTVGISGIWEFPLDAAGGEMQLGEYVDANASATSADGDAVTRAAAATNAIGLVAREKAPAATTVLVDIFSLWGKRVQTVD